MSNFSSLVTSVIGCLFNLMFSSWHGVAWLYDRINPGKIEDKGDLWIKTWGTQFGPNHQGRHQVRKEVQGVRECSANILSNITVLLVYFVSVVINIYGVMQLEHGGLQAYTTLAAFLALQLINTGVVLYSAHR